MPERPEGCYAQKGSDPFALAIYLDADAAGHGWYFDRTPMWDEEFGWAAHSTRKTARGAADRIDLLTVVQHELGHVLGLADADSAADTLMSATLPTGMRRNATPAEVDTLFARKDALDEVCRN